MTKEIKNQYIMKIVNTQFRTDELLTWDEIKELITTGIYEEDFIVLFDEKSENYVQMAEDEKGFVVESRVYDEGSFTHYRTFVEEPEAAIPFFEKYFNDESIDFSAWENVTDEFLS